MDSAPFIPLEVNPAGAAMAFNDKAKVSKVSKSKYADLSRVFREAFVSRTLAAFAPLVSTLELTARTAVLYQPDHGLIGSNVWSTLTLATADYA